MTSSLEAAKKIRTRVKICGLTRAQDVDAAVAAGADAVGFVLYEKSPRHISVAAAAALANGLPPFVTPVLLFVNSSQDQIAQACHAIPGALLQFHGDETPAECETVAASIGRRFIRAARIPDEGGTEHFDLVKYAQSFSKAQAILLDAHVQGYGGGGKVFPWSRLPPNVNAHLVLSGGLTPANVADGIRDTRSCGLSLAVDVSSGVEAAKGIKDPEKIQQFVAAVRAADRHFAETLHA